MGRISMECIQDPFVFITYCSWKTLRNPGLQINQLIIDTLINPSVTCFHIVFPHKILYKYFSSNFLIHNPNVPINTFTLPVIKVMLVSWIQCTGVLKYIT
jgi:hypothetical protein